MRGPWSTLVAQRIATWNTICDGSLGFMDLGWTIGHERLINIQSGLSFVVRDQQRQAEKISPNVQRTYLAAIRQGDQLRTQSASS
jgi:hypothetical protein